jgi:hypothetical protein
MLFGAIVVITIKLFTDLATPGWASSVAGLLSVILLQGLMLSAVATFMILNMRSMRPVVPRVDAVDFILSRHKVRSSVAAKIAE